MGHDRRCRCRGDRGRRRDLALAPDQGPRTQALSPLIRGGRAGWRPGCWEFWLRIGRSRPKRQPRRSGNTRWMQPAAPTVPEWRGFGKPRDRGRCSCAVRATHRGGPGARGGSGADLPLRPPGLEEAASQAGRRRASGLAHPDLCPLSLPDQRLRRQQQDPGAVPTHPPGDV